MIGFDIRQLFPRFLLEDPEGYAMARALSAGLSLFLETAEAGLDTWSNVDSMPEWRLDEMAWEYNIPYDYSADAEVKRGWIRNASRLQRLYGTAEGVTEFLKARFDDASISEAWEYGGEPYHFRLDITGEWTVARIQWARRAIEAAKNVRSVLDGTTVYPPEIGLDGQKYAGIGLYSLGWLHMGPTEQPDISGEDFLADELGNYLADENMVLMT